MKVIFPSGKEIKIDGYYPIFKGYAGRDCGFCVLLRSSQNAGKCILLVEEGDCDSLDPWVSFTDFEEKGFVTERNQKGFSLTYCHGKGVKLLHHRGIEHIHKFVYYPQYNQFCNEAKAVNEIHFNEFDPEQGSVVYEYKTIGGDLKIIIPANLEAFTHKVPSVISSEIKTECLGATTFGGAVGLSIIYLHKGVYLVRGLYGEQKILIFPNTPGLSEVVSQFQWPDNFFWSLSDGDTLEW